jgi:hypothetical protein
MKYINLLLLILVISSCRTKKCVSECHELSDGAQVNVVIKYNEDIPVDTTAKNTFIVYDISLKESFKISLPVNSSFWDYFTVGEVTILDTLEYH